MTFQVFQRGPPSTHARPPKHPAPHPAPAATHTTRPALPPRPARGRHVPPPVRPRDYFRRRWPRRGPLLPAPHRPRTRPGARPNAPRLENRPRLCAFRRPLRVPKPPASWCRPPFHYPCQKKKRAPPSSLLSMPRFSPRAQALREFHDAADLIAFQLRRATADRVTAVETGQILFSKLPPGGQAVFPTFQPFADKALRIARGDACALLPIVPASQRQARSGCLSLRVARSRQLPLLPLGTSSSLVTSSQCACAEAGVSLTRLFIASGVRGLHAGQLPGQPAARHPGIIPRCDPGACVHPHAPAHTRALTE